MRWTDPITWLILGALALFIFMASSMKSGADPIPVPTPSPYAQPHSLFNKDHWYPMACCNLMDCAPVEVTRTEEGYSWVPHRAPVERLTIKRGDSRIQASQDGGYHACERKFPAGGEYVICFFEPMMF